MHEKAYRQALQASGPRCEVGWLDQVTPLCDSTGWSATAGGTIPIPALGRFGPSFGETYGFGGTATEVGVGFGASAGVSVNRAWKLPWQLPGW